MCAGAAFWTQLGALVYGAADEKRGYRRISTSLTHPKTLVKGGVMARECGELLVEFFRKKREL
jgi:tRNA(adenine34) deaminase